MGNNYLAYLHIKNQDVYKWIILLISTGSQVSISLVGQGIGVLSPVLVDSLGLTRVQVGVVAGAINVGMAFTAIISGRIIDRWGIRLVAVLGCVLTGMSIITASLADEFLTLVPLLIFTGFWAASSTLVGSKAIVQWFPYSKRGFAMGVRQTGVPLGGFVAALVLPFIAGQYSWKAAFLTVGLVNMCFSVIWLLLYKDFPKNEKPLKNGVRVRELLCNRNILRASITAMTYVGAQFTIVTYLDLYLYEEIGVSRVSAGYFLAAALIGGVVGRVVWGMLSDTIFRGSRKLPMISSGVLIVVMSFTILLVTHDTPNWIIGTISLIFGFAAIGWNGVYITLISELAGKERIGTGLGVSLTIIQIGVLVIPPVFGLLIDLTHSYRTSWVMLASMVSLGLFLLGFVKEESSQSQDVSMKKILKYSNDLR